MLTPLLAEMTGNLYIAAACLGAATQFFGVKFEKAGGLFKIKRLHDARPHSR